MTNPAITYAQDIISGKLPAGEFINLGARRFLADLDRDDLYFDDETYDTIVRFFNGVLFDGQTWNGEPMVLAPFQHFLIANIYCLKYKHNDRRKTKHVYIQVGRKNTKTTTLAGLGLYELLASGENDPQILVGANNENQAKICTTQAGKMAESVGLQSEGVVIYKYQGKTHTIVYNNGSMESMSRDIKTKDGFMPSLGIIDEYHEAQDARLLNVIESGQGNRLEPLSIVITTAGYNKEGPCYQTLRKTSIDILNGTLEDDSHFSLIYEPDPDDEPGDRVTWLKANPMMNHVNSIEPYLEDRWRKAQNEGGETMVEFLTKNLNMWADSSSTPILDSKWVQNNEFMTWDEAFNELEGLECWGGIDLGDTGDMTAFVLYFPEFDAVLPTFWIPEAAKNHKKNRIIYNKWINEGFLRIAGNEFTDYRQVSGEIQEIAANFNIINTGYDKWRQSHGTIQDLLEAGFYLTEVPQTFNYLTDPIEEFILKGTKGDFRHYNNPVLRWMVSNLEIQRKDEQKRFNKSKVQNKIDGCAALVNAIAVYKDEDNTELVIYGV